jgi:hypothetical protein
MEILKSLCTKATILLQGKIALETKNIEDLHSDSIEELFHSNKTLD